MRAVRDDLDVAFVRLHDVPRSPLALAVDQMLFDLLIRRPETRVRRECEATCEPGGGDVRAPRFELSQGIADARHRIDEESDAELRGEPAREIEFRALRPGCAQVVAARRVAGDDAQLPRANDLLQDGRRPRARPEQQGREDGERDFQSLLSYAPSTRDSLAREAAATLSRRD